MHLFIIMVLGFLLLLPILYILPLSINLKGKYSLAAAALVFASLFIIGKDVIELWKVVLIFFLLFLLTVYFLEKKVGHWFSMAGLEWESSLQSESNVQEKNNENEAIVSEEIKAGRDEKTNELHQLDSEQPYMEEDVFSDHALEAEDRDELLEVVYIEELENDTLLTHEEDEILPIETNESEVDEHIHDIEVELMLRDLDFENIEVMPADERFSVGESEFNLRDFTLEDEDRNDLLEEIEDEAAIFPEDLGDDFSQFFEEEEKPINESDNEERIDETEVDLNKLHKAERKPPENEPKDKGGRQT